MSNILRAFLIVFLTAFPLSCLRMEPDLPADPLERSGMVRLYHEEDMTTRAEISGTTGLFGWTPGDKIAYCISDGATTRYDTGAVDAANQSVQVTLDAGFSRANYAVYPSWAVPASPTAAQFTTPSVVYPAAYDNRGRTAQTYSPCPMVADNTQASMTFFHVGSLVRVAMSSALPSGTARVRATFAGMANVTGTYNVSQAGTDAASLALSSGTGNVVTVTVDADDDCVNIPVPQGDYSSLTRITFEALPSGSDMPIKTRYKDIDAWGTLPRAGGKMMSVSWEDVVIMNAPATIWEGETVTYSAVSPLGTPTWSSSNTSVATVDPVSGVVTGVSAGTARITATAGGVSAFEYVYVNSLWLSSNVYQSVYFSPEECDMPLAFTVRYTTNGDYLTPSGSIISLTKSGASASLNGVSSVSSGEPIRVSHPSGGNATITATIPAGSIGNNPATSLTVTARVGDPTYYLTFDNGSSDVSVHLVAEDYSKGGRTYYASSSIDPPEKPLYYSTDLSTWHNVFLSDEPVIHASGPVYLCGNNGTFGNRFQVYNNGSVDIKEGYRIHGNFTSVEGDMLSLFDPSGEDVYNYRHIYMYENYDARGTSGLFKDNTYLKDISGLIIGQHDPEDPAGFFKNCSSLTTLFSYNYYCSSEQYEEMFANCTSLTSTPKLTGDNNNIYGMFDGCTNISTIYALFTTVRPDYSYENWARNVASSGSCYIDSSVREEITSLEGFIPPGWNVIDY